MSQKILDENEKEIEVYTADEVAAKAKEAADAKEAEYNPKLKKYEEDLAEAKTALGERASEFNQFRKLSDAAVAKLGVAEKTLYDNQLLMQKMNDDRKESEKKATQVTIDNVIKAKVGTDEKVIAKVKELWGMFNIEATTQEQIENKTQMILGAIHSTQPDLLTSVRGFGSGSHIPPEYKDNGDKTYGDTDAGKNLAKDLGLILEVPKK